MGSEMCIRDRLNENVPDENFEPSESECEDFEEDEEMGMEMSM